MLIKLGEPIQINKIENTASCVPAIHPDILASFSKFATDLKRIAPKADDFLYFSAVMMHAAEAVILNDDGTIKLTRSGEPVKVGWDKSGGTWKWFSNDPLVKPYKNTNGDIFPEEELVKAYKKWVGKPLCVDHKSSSVEHVRGFIADTYYDRDLKRVVALCALDKAGYPQLARQIETGLSNCVSMGTGVSKAICYDCGKVARAESDFCEHMRRKTGYGEINVDLNPIELSIVVNGADPKANIKHVIAAANTLNAYVEGKAAELNKLAKQHFYASIALDESDGSNPAHTKFEIDSDNLEKFKQDIQSACDKLEEITSSADTNSNNLTFNQSSAVEGFNDEISHPEVDSGLAPPHARFASELKTITASIEARLGQMKTSLDQMTASLTNQHEEITMSGNKDLNKQGYFQGGGGVNEPTPGQPKYPKEPLNEDCRVHEDKQMVGEKPFPEVGSVDDLHPSPASAGGGSELERKKMLARAEAEERALRRNAIVNLAKQALENKTAYWQGGGGVNEPTPGKPKYPKDPLNEKDREDADKQMVGQKPFPEVGAVDGLHPSPGSADVSDEKKRKEMLQRAELHAKFVKSANDNGSVNFAKSGWNVFLGDKLLLTATVDKLSGGRSELFYDSIATKDFGARLLSKVKAQGADKVAELFKSGQEAPPAVAPAAPEVPASPGADMGAPAAAPDVAQDTGKSGDVGDSALELAEKVRDLSSDMVEAVRALTGEQAEMGDMGAEMSSKASDETKALYTMRRELNTELSKALRETVASLQDYQKELNVLSDMHQNKLVNDSNREMVNTIAADCFSDSKSAVAEGVKLMEAFVKYARGTKAMEKRAEIERDLEALATSSEGEHMHDSNSTHDSSDKSDLMSLISDTNADLDAVKDMMSTESVDSHSLTSSDKSDSESCMVDDNNLQAKPEELKDLNVKPGGHVDVVAGADFDTKEGRAQLRAKLAAETLKFSPILDDAHPKGGFTTQLDVKPEGNLARVEDLPEQNDMFMDVATAPPKVRKEAEAIHKLISEGKMSAADLDALVAEGVDKDAVAYYKKYYGQVDGGSEFATELVKEHVKAQVEAETSKYRVKIARAYELAYDMVERGLCHMDRGSISNQVDDIMKYNDESFESLKRVVAKHAPIMHKQAAAKLPQVGILGSGDMVSSSVDASDLSAGLNAAFSGTNRRMF